MLQQIDEPTHRGGHTLDHVYINPYQMSPHHHVVNESLGFTSDHFPVILQIPNCSTDDTTQTLFYID